MSDGRRNRGHVPGRRDVGVWVAVVSLLISSVAEADPVWRVTPRVTVGATYTDNVNLAPPGQESHDWIGEVVPGVTAYREGRRWNASVNYSLWNRYYLRHSGRNRARHTLQAASNLEVVDRTFFVDATATRRERAASLLEPVGVSADTGALATVTTAAVSPYAVQRFGRFAEGEVRYTYDRIWYQRTNQGDSAGHRWEGVLASGPLFGPRFFWRLNYSHERHEYDDDLRPDETFERYSATLGYRISPRLQVFGTAGEERNDYPTILDEQDGDFWEVGAIWDPTRRTHIEAAYGEQFFGETGRLDLRHRTRRSTWRAGYTRTVTTGRRLVLQEETFDPADPNAVLFLFLLFGPEDFATFVDMDEGVFFLPRLTDEPVIAERATASVTYQLGRSRFVLSANRFELDFQDGITPNESGHGAAAGWNWQFAPRTASQTSIGWTRTEFDLDEPREDDRYFLQVRVTKDFTPHLTGSLSYRHQRRDSSAGRVWEYRENAVIARATMTF